MRMQMFVILLMKDIHESNSTQKLHTTHLYDVPCRVNWIIFNHRFDLFIIIDWKTVGKLSVF